MFGDTTGAAFAALFNGYHTVINAAGNRIANHTDKHSKLATGTERGASMVEYALLLVLVLLVAFFSITLFGDTIVALFRMSATTMKDGPGAVQTP